MGFSRLCVGNFGPMAAALVVKIVTHPHTLRPKHDFPVRTLHLSLFISVVCSILKKGECFSVLSFSRRDSLSPPPPPPSLSLFYLKKVLSVSAYFAIFPFSSLSDFFFFFWIFFNDHQKDINLIRLIFFLSTHAQKKPYW